MNKLGIPLAALGAVCFVSYANAADIAMGKEKSEACAACHGANGISVSENFPNLAGQKEKYLGKQLHAFKAKTRENTLMNAITEQLSDEDIGDLAAFFSSQLGGDGKEKSTLVAAINKSRVTFPKDYKSTYTKYTTISFAAKKQVRHYYANSIAVAAAKAGKPLPNGSKIFVEAFKVKLDDYQAPIEGADGHLVAASDNPAFFTAMEMQAGWGEDIPDILRNGDWNYAVFSATGELKSSVNQASCLACHKPLADISYVFSLPSLTEAIAE
jgi:cytochrome c553